LRVGIIFMALAGLCGCGGGAKGPPVEQPPPQSPLDRAKMVLNGYLVEGATVGSEAMGFEQIVADVRKTDPQKATILEKGFENKKRNWKGPGPKARRLPRAVGRGPRPRAIAQ